MTTEEKVIGGGGGQEEADAKEGEGVVAMGGGCGWMGVLSLSRPPMDEGPGCTGRRTRQQTHAYNRAHASQLAS